jgi:perosamine synthetase
MAEVISKPAPKAATNFIPLCVPHISGNEWEYVKECLDTGWVSSVGSYVNRFESMTADYVGTKHAIAAVSGTAALHTALLVAGVEPDDEVLVSSLSFIAPANAVRYCGAWPVFVDVDPDYWEMDHRLVAEFLETKCSLSQGALVNKETGRRVRAILPVHILGHPVDIDPLLELARRYDLKVIEDATESLGALYKDRKVGRLGDIACFSFNGNKLITTGGGGMIVTDNDEWARRAKYLTTQAKDDEIEYVHESIGYNYRLTNVQAALGCAQLEQIAEFIEKKRTIARRYEDAIRSIPGLSPMPHAAWANPVFWLYTILVDETVYGEDSRALMRRLAQNNIQARPLWQPLHRSPAHATAQACGGEVTDRLNRLALSLPCSVGLEPHELDSVIAVISRAHG